MIQSSSLRARFVDALRRPRDTTVTPPRHRLIRDSVEAEAIAVDWMRWVGVSDARRVDTEQPLGIVGSPLSAGVYFDPLPMELGTLEELHLWASEKRSSAACFTFAGWTRAAHEFAEAFRIPLVRFTFAGHLEPTNAAAASLVEAATANITAA